jgi:hypothetical protein
MRHPQILCVLVLISTLAATAQVFPSSNGSCTVAASGVEGCNWLSAVNLHRAAPNKTTSVAEKSSPSVFTTRFILAPGALLDSRQIVGREVLILGKNNGEIRNEKKSSSGHIDVFDGLVMYMPKGEPYLLRNVGQFNVDLLLVEIRK